MKKIIIASLVSGIILTSCHKNNEDVTAPEVTEAAAANGLIVKSGWQPLALQSGTPDSKGISLSTGDITSEAVTDGIVSEGMVLVFARTGSAVNTLPFSSGSESWNYDVSGKLIEVSVSGAAGIPSADVYYVILDAAKVASIEKGGYSRNDLLNISYDKAKILLGLE